MTEVNLEVEKWESSGKTGYNLNLRKLDEDQSVVVTKDNFAEGQEFVKPSKFGNGTYRSYRCTVAYGDKSDVSFWLYENDHNGFAATGGVGDKVRITKREEKYVKKNGQKAIREYFDFEVVN